MRFNIMNEEWIREPEIYTTDIDRLHDVVLGDEVGRGCGKTYARIHELATLVELGECERIICQITMSSDIQYLKPMVQGIFSERGLLCYFDTTRTMVSGNCHVHFMTREMIDQLSFEEAGFVPMGHED